MEHIPSRQKKQTLGMFPVGFDLNALMLLGAVGVEARGHTRTFQAPTLLEFASVPFSTDTIWKNSPPLRIKGASVFR